MIGQKGAGAPGGMLSNLRLVLLQNKKFLATFFSEFQLRNYPEAISLYGQVFQRSKDKTVKAWIKSRIARCEVKRKDFKQAVAAYRSVIEEFPGLLTESGRSLGIASRTEVLDALRADGNYSDFFQEALQILGHLETDYWSIDGDQVELYETLVSQAVDHFGKENGPAGFKVEMRVDKDLPPVLADEEALQQALHNILDNAAKFSRREKTIEVSVSRRPDSVEVAVEDRGIGIPGDEQKKIFEKFYRGKQASSVSPTGTGLGLTLVKHIMEAHGGGVTVRSQPGKGTRVGLILPLEKGN